MVLRSKRKRSATVADVAEAPVEESGSAEKQAIEIADADPPRRNAVGLRELPGALPPSSRGAAPSRAGAKVHNVAKIVKSGEVPQGAAPAEAAEPETPDRRGIVHMASVPAFMHADKVRHLMEEYGEVGRVYLAPEEKTETARRKRAGGTKRTRFVEGWIEFLDRRIAKRVAMTLNGSTIGGRKCHNYYRDDMWNLKYLPKFKWHNLKDGVIYNRQVRKARLEQKLSQGKRENDMFLERVVQAKQSHAITERRRAKGQDKASARVGRDDGGERRPRFEHAAQRERRPAKETTSDGTVSDKLLNSLFG